MGNKASSLLNLIQKKLGGEVKTSARGVPYLLLPGEERFSVCYFGKGNFFRSWRGCGTLKNEKYKNFSVVMDVVEHFSSLGFANDE